MSQLLSHTAHTVAHACTECECVWDMDIKGLF